MSDPALFEKSNVLYHYPVNRDRLVIGKFCSIGCGARFLFNSANHTMSSLSSCPFPIFYEEWGLKRENVAAAWDNKGDIIIGSDAITAAALLEIRRWDCPASAQRAL